MKLHFKVDGGLHQSQYISIDVNNCCFTTVQYYPHNQYMELGKGDFEKLFKLCVEYGFSSNWYM